MYFLGYPLGIGAYTEDLIPVIRKAIVSWYPREKGIFVLDGLSYGGNIRFDTAHTLLKLAEEVENSTRYVNKPLIVIYDENDETIYRKDADVNEIQHIKNDSDGYGKIWREFQSDKKPSYWVVWPYSTSKGWCERIIGNL